MSFSTMYIASTGMLALGTGMQTISNNLANIDTVGFKTMRTNYEDLISQCYISGGNHNQVGRGAKVSTIQSMFTQGPFKSAQQDTDLAIAGEGFFNVRTRDGDIAYTRAGVYTWKNDGSLQDPSGNILQGWQMSVPKPGQTPVRLGSPVDIKITSTTAPPVATTTVRSVSNLNADDESAFNYPAYAQADQYAKTEAGTQAEAARAASAQAVWYPATAGGTDAPVTSAGSTLPSGLTPSNKDEYNGLFVKNYNARFGTNYDPASAASVLASMEIVADGSADPANGDITQSQFQALVAATNGEMTSLATTAGQDAYDATYYAVYQDTYSQATSGMSGWQWEGDGFAAAWDPTKSPPMDKSSYTYSEPLTVYDSLGNEHTLTVYYQKNPHMENVWDYIVTADPNEDARSAGGAPLSSQPTSFTGLIQKGKITFTGDDAQAGHGGLIKSLEAQNIDLAKSLSAKVDPPAAGAGASSAMTTAKIGGYYTGSPAVDPATGQAVTSARTYTLTWGPNTNTSPPMSAITWMDNAGNTGTIPISDKSYPGPYTFGSGLSVTFDSNNKPLNFASGDSLTITAHSEQTAWANAAPNADGHFDLKMSFVDTSKATGKPPYPSGTPTLTQTVSLDLGAKSAGGGVWIPDEIGTTQYASQSLTVAKDQDGYPESGLERVYVREDGMVIGVYGSKREEALYQVSLTRFLNPWGLDKKGDNLFAKSRFTDEGVTTAPGEDGAGTVLGNFLEQSNVDTATEIVQMILTQRGFQANSKAITTSDTMIATAIQVKK